MSKNRQQGSFNPTSFYTETNHKETLMPGRNSQVVRIYTILNLLEGAPQGLTATEIAERIKDTDHQASKRTVYRDLEALCGAGFPLYTEDKSGSEEAQRWILQRTAKVAKYLLLSARELVALYLARNALKPLENTPFYDDLNTAFQKIEEKFGDKNRAYFQELGSEMLFEPGPRWGLGLDPDLLETVRACCAEKQVLSVSYSSANSKTKRIRRLGPHYLYFAQSSLYLVAEDLDEEKVKVFSVPRMSDAQMLDEEYAKEPVLPETFFEHSFGVFHGDEPVEVQIEFGPTVAPFVKERRWHHSQRVVTKSDGTILVTLQVTLTPDLTQWVLGFGANARVLSPERLRNEVVAAAQSLVRAYEKKRVA